MKLEMCRLKELFSCYKSHHTYCQFMEKTQTLIRAESTECRILKLSFEDCKLHCNSTIN